MSFDISIAAPPFVSRTEISSTISVLIVGDDIRVATDGERMSILISTSALLAIEGAEGGGRGVMLANSSLSRLALLLCVCVVLLGVDLVDTCVWVSKPESKILLSKSVLIFIDADARREVVTDLEDRRSRAFR